MDFDVDPAATALPTRNLVLSVCDLKQSGVTPIARAAAQMATLNGRIYLYGGVGANGEIFGDLYLLDVARMEWTLLTCVGEVPPAVFGHALVPISDRHLALVGGVVPSNTPSSSFDMSSVTECPLPFMPEVSYRSSGLNSGVFVLDTQTLQWTRFAYPSSCSVRAFAAVCALPSGAVFLHGGFTCERLSDSQTGAADSAYVLEFHDGRLTGAETLDTESSGTLPRAAGHGCAFVEGAIYLTVGRGTSEVYVVNSNTFRVSRCEARGGVPELSSRFQSVHAPLGSRCVVFGGEVYAAVASRAQPAPKAQPATAASSQTLHWSKPLYEGGAMRMEAPATTVLGDKVVLFGGVRSEGEGEGEGEKQKHKFSRKLCFFSILELRGDEGGSGSGTGAFKFKIVTVGDSGVGKSCILTRFITDTYNEEHESTISFDYKTITTMLRGRLCRLQLWDTAGQERFSVIAGSFYRGADAFVLVYDCTDRKSFEHIDGWLSQIQQHQSLGSGSDASAGAGAGAGGLVLLVGNKYDLRSQVAVSEEEGREKARSLTSGGLTCGFLAVSAKSSANVDRAFLSLAAELVDQRKAAKQRDTPLQQGASASASAATVRLRAQPQGYGPGGGGRGGNCCQ